MTGPEGEHVLGTRPSDGDERSVISLRTRVDDVDEQIVELLVERVSLACALAKEKSNEGADLYDPAREAAVVRNAASAAGDRGLEVEEVREIYWRVIRLCRGVQGVVR